MIRLKGWRMCFRTWRANPGKSLWGAYTAPALYGSRDRFLATK